MQTQLITGAAIFVLSLVLTSAAGAVFLVKIPPDHFCRVDDAAKANRRWTPINSLLILLKNLLGIIIVFVGIVLSIPGIPGQGLLTILLGLMLIDIPGKRGMEVWILHRRGVLTTINKLRARFDRPPLVFDE